MGATSRAEGSHGAWKERSNNRGRRSDGYGVVVDRVGGVCGNLRREVMGRCGGMGQRITKEATLSH